MTGYSNERRKTPVRFFWRLCLQTAGAIGVFFMVLSLFGWHTAEAVPLQQAVRACFTSDADLTPVIEWMEGTGTTADLDALQASAPGYRAVQE